MKFCNTEDQYKKFPDTKKEDVQKLMDWCSKQPHLPKNITELEVILFLHSNYNKMEAAKMTIDNYYTSRTHMSQFFGARDVKSDDMAVAHDLFTMIPLPKLTKEGYKVILVKLHNTDPSKFDLSDTLKLFSFFCDQMLLEQGCMEGHIIVFDMNGVTLSHVARLTIMAIKNYLYYLQEALPFRLKGLHFINIVPFIDKIVFLMKPFMKKELWDVFHLDSTMDAVYERIDPSIFPKDYEKGEENFVEYFHESCYKHLVEWRDYFLNEEKTKKVNEKLRAQKRKDAEGGYGLEGNFKKLDID
uniref:CSON013469 protein n=1 Tax=Culicoides sonorensis TaxID=179676 RepID=A0A336M8X4_CULSO